jgi:hypothetical protein
MTGEKSPIMSRYQRSRTSASAMPSTIGRSITSQGSPNRVCSVGGLGSRNLVWRSGGSSRGGRL